MTNLTECRIATVIERLEHYATNLKWTNVQGAQDLLAAADGLRELQERRNAEIDNDPVADVVAWSHPTEERTCDIRWRRHDVEPGPLYRHAQQPVVPEDIPDSVYEILCQACGGKAWMYEEALWNACRAAMLEAIPPAPKVIYLMSEV